VHVRSDSSAARALDADSAHWVRALRSAGPEQDAAVGRLHERLVRVARSEVNRRAHAGGVTGPELDDLAHQAAEDALMAIVEKVGQFRGDSRFTTWAYRFVVLEVSMKLGRHFWRSAPRQIDGEEWDVLPDRFGLSPARRAEWRELVTALRCAVEEELTPHQRRIFVAIVLRGVPLDALVVQLGSNRNAVYKAMFDARRKLRRSLAANGYVDHDTLGLS
jgi:RNA polymerase sigma-70 factor (ECF subfamily)